MFSFSQLNEVQILMFGLILFRMSAFVISAAIFSTANIQAHLKILMSVVFTIVVFNSVATNAALVRLSEAQNDILLLAAREAAIGVTLGFVTRFFFFAVSMAGEIVSITTGLGQAQMFNPLMGTMSNAMEQFYSIIATLVFLAMNGHHTLILGVVESFNSTPVAQLSFHVNSFAEIVLKIQSFFIIGIKISAPVLISMIIVQLGLALLSRVVPQINVLVTSAPITTMLGFVIMFVSLPLMVLQFSGVIDFSMNEFFKFLRTI